MACKVVFFYNQGASGWTETYYSTQSTANGAVASITPALLKAAIACRAPGTQLFAIRGSVVDVLPRSSITLFFGNTYIVPPQAGDDKQPDIVGTDALMSLSGASFQPQRKLYLRGLNDFNTLRGASFNSEPTGLLIKGIDLMMKNVVACGLAIRYGIRPPTSPLVWYPVLKVGPFGSSPNWSTVNVQGLPTWTAGTQLLFEGVPKNHIPGFPRLGVLRVNAIPSTVTVGTTDLIIPYLYRSDVDEYHPPAMRVTQNVYGYAAIGGWQFESFTTHKTGRAFGVARGRSRAVVKAH
jgi:hypothetical protein